MRTSTVTIGITAFREGELLSECWSSVLSQDDDRWEAVLVLDGGADVATTRIFDSIVHPRARKFKFINNVGPYPARAKAIRESRTQWYAHLDADDRLPPSAVCLIVAAVERDPYADYVFGDCRHFDRKSSHIRCVDQRRELVAGTGVVCATAPIRVSLFDEVGGFSSDLSRGGADLDFWIGVAERRKNGARAKGVIYERRIRPGSVGSVRQPRNVEIATIIVNRHPAYFADPVRKRAYLGKVYQKMARYYRTAGDRNRAAEMAQLAIGNGDDADVLRSILREARMPSWRFLARRLARRLPLSLLQRVGRA